MKKIFSTAITAIVLLFGISDTAKAIDLDSLQLRARAGYSVGGTAPLPLPSSIRSIDSYSLTPSFMVGFDAMLPIHDKWGVSVGLHFENKGMNGDVTTKGYHMELIKGGTAIEGLFTGHVCQKATQWMLTLPVQATLQLGRKVTLRGGPYFSLLLSKDFSGIASDGYLRHGSPTGPKVLIGSKEGEWATYDFDDEMRNFQFGLGVGADWQLGKRLGVSADLNWGLTGIFPGDFKAVEQTLYPIYFTVGVFYRFK